MEMNITENDIKACHPLGANFPGNRSWAIIVCFLATDVKHQVLIDMNKLNDKDDYRGV